MSHDTDTACDSCPSVHAVTWSPVFDAHLCPQCRWVRTEHELGPTPRIWPLPHPPTAETGAGAHP